MVFCLALTCWTTSFTSRCPCKSQFVTCSKSDFDILHYYYPAGQPLSFTINSICCVLFHRFLSFFDFHSLFPFLIQSACPGRISQDHSSLPPKSSGSRRNHLQSITSVSHINELTASNCLNVLLLFLDVMRFLLSPLLLFYNLIFHLCCNLIAHHLVMN